MLYLVQADDVLRAITVGSNETEKHTSIHYTITAIFSLLQGCKHTLVRYVVARIPESC